MLEVYRQHAEAEVHLRQALDWQPDYTAAWKLLGKTLVAQQQSEAACTAYRRGIEVAEAHGAHLLLIWFLTVQ